MQKKDVQTKKHIGEEPEAIRQLLSVKNDHLRLL